MRPRAFIFCVKQCLVSPFINLANYDPGVQIDDAPEASLSAIGLFFIGSSSFLQVSRTTVKSWNSSKFGQIQPCTAELAALDRPKKSFTHWSIQNIFMTCWPSGERSLSFGLLVIINNLNFMLS